MSFYDLQINGWKGKTTTPKEKTTKEKTNQKMNKFPILYLLLT